MIAGVLARVFSALFFAAGSLRPPMLIHGLIDPRIPLLVRSGGRRADGTLIRFDERSQ